MLMFVHLAADTPRARWRTPQCRPDRMSPYAPGVVQYHPE